MKEIEQDEKDWSEQASLNRLKYKWLSFFTNRGVIEIYKLIKSSDPLQLKAHHIIKRLRFLITSSYNENELQQAVAANIVSHMCCHHYYNYHRTYYHHLLYLLLKLLDCILTVYFQLILHCPVLQVFQKVQLSFISVTDILPSNSFNIFTS